ncbi:MAG: hypothetical protein WCY19_08425 [Candidatus Gastranaerophilaceae bacterium]
MNITFKDTSNISGKAKIKPMARVPFSHPSELLFSKSPFNNLEERPLKPNSQNLSFKGFFYKPVLDEATKAAKVFDSKELLAMSKGHLGPQFENLFYDIEKNIALASRMFKNEGGKVTFHKKSLPALIFDGILFPIKELPMEIVNSFVRVLKKIKPLEKWADNIYEKPVLKRARQRSKIDAKVNALRGGFETIEKLKTTANKEIELAIKENRLEDVGKIEEKLKKDLSDSLYQQSTKMNGEKTGNYNTKDERALCRIVSGSVPAFFLANDAYNLSSMCDNNKQEAEKEKKIRFRQEASRILLNAYITLVTFGAIPKLINNSKGATMLVTGITVLLTEMFARLANGKHIKKLTPEQAKAINAKNGNAIKDDAKDKADKEEYKNVFFRASKNKNSFDEISKGKAPQFKGFSEVNTAEQKKQEPLLSFNSIMKACAIIIAAGFGIKALRKIHSVDALFKKVSKPFNNSYKKLAIDYDSKITRENFDEIIKKLKDERFGGKFDKFADKSEEIANSVTKDGFVHLGKKDKGIRPVIDFVLAPFGFIWSAVKLPYSIVDKMLKLCGIIKAEAKNPKTVSELNLEALAKTVNKIGKGVKVGKNKKLTDIEAKKFEDFVTDNIVKSFNLDSISNVSNNELSNLAKTSATAATIWFLMADNYNMVMLKSNGEDKEGANLKFKERFVQEGSRLFYQTLLIDLFNSTFRTQYNNSLFGMSWVTATCTFLSEILTRKSIGMPIGQHSRDELITIENKKQNATGFVKAYYNFMSKLTGKKSLAEQQQAKKGK